MSGLILEVLRRLHLVLASTTVLMAVGLAAYLFAYNVRNAVARAFVGLLGLIAIIAVGDVFLATARFPAEHVAAIFWLRFEWLGIAFIAPAFVHFAYAVLATTGARPRHRQLVVPLAWGGGAAALVAVFGGPSLVRGVVGFPGALRLTAGPWFPAFAVAYFALTAWGLLTIDRARHRALAERTRRGAALLMAAAVGPVSAFPFLTGLGGGLAGSTLTFRTLSVAANASLTATLVFLAYIVAYHGALTPDRVVRRDLIKYLVQGPLLGAWVLLAIQLVPERLEHSLGLPRDIVLMLFVIGGIVTYPFVIRALKPLVDGLLYGLEGTDVRWLRRLDERLLTDHDLAQLFENILCTLCDRLRLSGGCVVVIGGGRASLDASIGPRDANVRLLEALDRTFLEALSATDAFLPVDGHIARALRPRGVGVMLGVLALAAPDRPLSPAETAAVRALVARSEEALEDRLIQQRVLGALHDLEPELAGIQRLRGVLADRTPSGDQRDGEPAWTAGRTSPSDAWPPEDVPVERSVLPTLVKDALSHYWGGPKLTESPLLELDVSRRALDAYDHNAARALRSVLDRGLAALRPDGERSLAASEWLLYNILELKFVRGLTSRDIARRLDMSEASLYRKQRLAVDALAQQLAQIESGGREKPPDA